MRLTGDDLFPGAWWGNEYADYAELYPFTSSLNRSYEFESSLNREYEHEGSLNRSFTFESGLDLIGTI